MPTGPGLSGRRGSRPGTRGDQGPRQDARGCSWCVLRTPVRVPSGASEDTCPLRLSGAARLDAVRAASFSLAGLTGQYRGTLRARGVSLRALGGAFGPHCPNAVDDVAKGAKDEEWAERRMGGKRYEKQDAKNYDKIAECELDPPVGVQEVRCAHAIILSRVCAWSCKGRPFA